MCVGRYVCLYVEAGIYYPILGFRNAETKNHRLEGFVGTRLWSWGLS